jgi:hypothetical protein
MKIVLVKEFWWKIVTVLIEFVFGNSQLDGNDEKLQKQIWLEAYCWCYQDSVQEVPNATWKHEVCANHEVCRLNIVNWKLTNSFKLSTKFRTFCHWAIQTLSHSNSKTTLLTSAHHSKLQMYSQILHSSQSPPFPVPNPINYPLTNRCSTSQVFSSFRFFSRHKNENESKRKHEKNSISIYQWSLTGHWRILHLTRFVRVHTHERDDVF